MNDVSATRFQTAFVIAAQCVTVLMIIIGNFVDVEDFFTDMSNYVYMDIARVSTSMLLIFIFMHSKYYEDVRSGSDDLVSLAVSALVFGNLALLAICTGQYFDMDVYIFSAITIMIAGLIGGYRVVVPSILYCLIMSALLIQDIDLIVYPSFLAIVIVSGAAGSYIHGKNNCNWILWIIPMITFIDSLLIVLLGLGLDGLTDTEVNTYKMSAISTLVASVYSVCLYDVFTFMIRTKDYATRSEKDLSIAHEIQMASLPSEFPESRSVEIFANMTPATEVGGDFYDCFQISRNLTAFVVADVSDKGLPASMLMMRMMGSIKASAMLSNDPGKVLTAVNAELCRNNPVNQFLTAWMGVYDSDTSTLVYANAGHTPPYIRRGSGVFEKLEVKKGPIIGFSDAVRYKTSSIIMEDGDSIFSYTDGVNEAFNLEDEQFGHARLSTALNDCADLGPRGIVEHVTESIERFTEGNVPSDDITMMSILFHRPPHAVITVPGNIDRLGEVNDFIEEVLSEGGCPMKEILKLQIVTEEIFVNICDHAYENMDGDVTVHCRYYMGEAKITFSDDAAFFNPINKEDIEIDEDVGNWPIGGFGIHMVKNLVTYMDYKYFANKNIFTVWKKVEH